VFAMPAARTTASAMVERDRRGCISILTTRHDLKTPDHGRLARSREHSRRQVGTRLRSASRVLENSSPRVRRSLRCTSITLGILNARAAKHAVPAFLCARSGSYFRSVTGTGAELGAFIGMPARVLDGAVMESEAMVAAHAVVTEVDACSAGTRTGAPSSGTQELSCTDDDHLELDRPEQCCGVCLLHCRPERSEGPHRRSPRT
jgi:hypothetical protein